MPRTKDSLYVTPLTALTAQFWKTLLTAWNAIPSKEWLYCFPLDTGARKSYGREDVSTFGGFLSLFINTHIPLSWKRRYVFQPHPQMFFGHMCSLGLWLPFLSNRDLNSHPLFFKIRNISGSFERVPVSIISKMRDLLVLFQLSLNFCNLWK